jgi:hypothetical protein
MGNSANMNVNDVNTQHTEVVAICVLGAAGLWVTGASTYIAESMAAHSLLLLPAEIGT